MAGDKEIPLRFNGLRAEELKRQERMLLKAEEVTVRTFLMDMTIRRMITKEMLMISKYVSRF